MVYVFSCDFGDDSARANAIMAVLAANTRRMLRVMSGTLLLDSAEPVERLGRLIIEAVSGVRFLLTRVERGGYYGWHSRETWDWINEGLTQNPH